MQSKDVGLLMDRFMEGVKKLDRLPFTVAQQPELGLQQLYGAEGLAVMRSLAKEISTKEKWREFIREIDTTWPLDWSDLDDRQAMVVLFCVSDRKFVRALDLSNNSISDQILPQFCRMLDRLLEIKEVNLHGNPCFESGLAGIMFRELGWGEDSERESFVRDFKEEAPTGVSTSTASSSAAPTPSDMPPAEAPRTEAPSMGEPLPFAAVKSEEPSTEAPISSSPSRIPESSPGAHNSATSATPQPAATRNQSSQDKGSKSHFHSEQAIDLTLDSPPTLSSMPEAEYKRFRTEQMMEELDRICKKPRIGSVAVLSTVSCAENNSGRADATVSQPVASSASPAKNQDEEERPATQVEMSTDECAGGPHDSFDFDSFGRDLIKGMTTSVGERSAGSSASHSAAGSDQQQDSANTFRQGRPHSKNAAADESHCKENTDLADSAPKSSKDASAEGHEDDDMIIIIDDSDDEKDGASKASLTRKHLRYHKEGRKAPGIKTPEYKIWHKAVRHAVALIVDKDMCPSEACEVVDKRYGQKFEFKGGTLSGLVSKYGNGRIPRWNFDEDETPADSASASANTNIQAPLQDSSNEQIDIIEIDSDDDQPISQQNESLPVTMASLKKQLSTRPGKPAPVRRGNWRDPEYVQWRKALHKVAALVLDRGVNIDEACAQVDAQHGMKFEFAGKMLLTYLAKYKHNLIPRWDFDSEDGGHEDPPCQHGHRTDSDAELPVYRPQSKSRPTKAHLQKSKPARGIDYSKWVGSTYLELRRSERQKPSIPGMYKEVSSETTQEMSKMECINAWREGKEVPYLCKFPIADHSQNRLPRVIKGRSNTTNPGNILANVIQIADDSDQTASVIVDPRKIAGRRFSEYCILGEGVETIFEREVVHRSHHDLVEVDGQQMYDLTSLGLTDFDKVCQGIYSVLQQGSHKGVSVVELKDPKHPAVQEQNPWGMRAYGVQANTDLPAFTVIGEYVGRVQLDDADDEPEPTKSERDDRRACSGTRSSRSRADSPDEDTSKLSEEGDFFYELALPGLWNEKSDESLFLEASKVSNEMAYINDSKGTGTEHNAVYLGAWINKWPVRVVILVKKVKKGEEVLCHYGDSFWQAVDKKKESRREKYIESISVAVKTEILD